MFNQPRLVFLLAVVVSLLLGRPAGAYKTGISGYSGKQGTICNACHSGGLAPNVAFTGPTTLDPGNTGDFTFTVQSQAPDVQSAAGFNVAASGGTLRTVAAQAQKEQEIDGELTHTEPKPNDDSGSASWAFKWKAPTKAGNYILYGAGNSVDQSNTPEGDRAASTVYFIAVGNVTPLLTRTPTSTPVPSPTPTPPFTATAPPSATSVPTSTPTPPPTDTLPATATPVFSQTPLLTDTPEPSATSSPVGTAMPTAVPIGEGTPTATSTLAPTVTATATPSMLPTPVAQRGDANCDGLITAADLPQLLTLLPLNDAGRCGAADANGDGSVNELDLLTTIAAMFEPRS